MCEVCERVAETKVATMLDLMQAREAHGIHGEMSDEEAQQIIHADLGLEAVQDAFLIALAYPVSIFGIEVDLFNAKSEPA